MRRSRSGSAEGFGCQGLELSLEERQTCREALQGLLTNIYQPVVIKELLALQRGHSQVSCGGDHRNALKMGQLNA